VPRKQNENLIPNTKRTPSELREITQKGGKASGEARRKKKALREEMEELLSITLKNEKLIQNLQSLGIPVGKGATLQTAITAAMIHQAAKGNVKAFIAIRDTIDPIKEDGPIDSGINVQINVKDCSGEEKHD
jgi:hypothetical protein